MQAGSRELMEKQRTTCGWSVPASQPSRIRRFDSFHASLADATIGEGLTFMEPSLAIMALSRAEDDATMLPVFSSRLFPSLQVL